MIILKATTESLQMTTSTAAGLDISVSYSDITTTTFAPSSNELKISSATTTAILAAPAASTQRQVKLITVSNRDASLTDAIVIQKVISGTTYNLTPTFTLLVGETLQYMDSAGWIYYSATGTIKNQQTAAGNNQAIQYNNNGLVAGDPGFLYNSTTNTLWLNDTASSIQINTSSTTVPSSPPTGTLEIFARTIANRQMTAQIGPTGLDTALQPFMARNKVGYWDPPGNATTLPGVFGITALTANGTATARTVATTSLATRMRRLGFPSSATAGTFAGARLPVAQFSCGSGSPDGSGFMLVERWVESDPAAVSGRRAFHGMTSSAAAFTNVEVSTLTNLVGVCQLSTDATQWYWIGAGSSAQSATAIGTTIGAPAGNSTTAWELAIFAPNGVANTYYLQLTNITSGVVVTTTMTGAATLVPQSTTLLAWNAWATNNATALAVGIDLCSLYIETDT
jgi:hypothetical protein